MSTCITLTYHVLDRITNYTSLIAFALRQLSPTNAEGSAWFKDFGYLITNRHPTSNDVTSVLVPMASSLSSGRPLPPHLSAPEVAQPMTSPSDGEKDILSISDIKGTGWGEGLPEIRSKRLTGYFQGPDALHLQSCRSLHHSSTSKLKSCLCMSLFFSYDSRNGRSIAILIT